MDQKMQVRMTVWQNDDALYQGIVLRLPTHPEAIKDAYQRARAIDVNSYELSFGKGWLKFLVPILQNVIVTLGEANLLANRLSKMSEKEIWVYEAALETFPDRTIKTIIDTSYNLNCFEFQPYIVCDEEIGEMVIENELEPILQGLPEDVYYFLDKKKVGAHVREKEHGVFTKNGYGYRNGEPWNDVYDRLILSEQQEGSSYMFSLHLVPNGLDVNQDSIVWLELPCDEVTKKEVLHVLGVNSLAECEILEIRSAVPWFEESLNRTDGVNYFNLLAKEMAALSEKELTKFKAVVEMKSCCFVSDALELLYRLNQYELDIQQVSYAQYGRECLSQMGVDLTGRAFRNFDFRLYGKEEYERMGKVLTAYGAVYHEASPELSMEEDNLQMGGME